MTSRDFCYWLQGYFEIDRHNTNPEASLSLVMDQVDCIKKHLAMVFKHEIDPSFGKDNTALNEIHENIGGVGPNGTLYRC